MERAVDGGLLWLRLAQSDAERFNSPRHALDESWILATHLDAPPSAYEASAAYSMMEGELAGAPADYASLNGPKRPGGSAGPASYDTLAARPETADYAVLGTGASRAASEPASYDVLAGRPELADYAALSADGRAKPPTAAAAGAAGYYVLADRTVAEYALAEEEGRVGDYEVPAARPPEYTSADGPPSAYAVFSAPPGDKSTYYQSAGEPGNTYEQPANLQ